ncbi:MAG: Ig-like domain-containing protein, partial [Gemmatimonadota bacterium]
MQSNVILPLGDPTVAASLLVGRGHRARGRRLAAVVFLLGAACGGPASAPQASVSDLVLGPDHALVFVADSLQLTAQARDASGNALSNRPITYASSNRLVATVSGSGLVTGLASGQVTISASCEGRSAEVGVDVRGGGVIGASGGSVTLMGGTARLSV